MLKLILLTLDSSVTLLHKPKVHYQLLISQASNYNEQDLYNCNW